MKVCIDAGHGGSDPGAVGTAVAEKQIALEVANRGIIGNKELWLKKLAEDTDAYWLARKAANYMREM